MGLFPAARVLVPVDLSPVSSAAWAWAKALSSPGADLRALYAHEMGPAPVLGMPAPPPSAEARARTAARLRAAFPGGRERVEVGDPVALIARAARRADLVVMGSHGRRGLDRALLGSVCEAVVRECPAPVLTVRRGPRRVASVLAPVNLAPYARKGLALAAQAALFLGAELVVLHVTPERARGANPRIFLNGFLDGLPAARRSALKVRLVRRAGPSVREILLESRRHGLVVLTAHRKSLLADLVLGTTAERILRFSPIPVLTAPSGRA